MKIVNQETHRYNYDNGDVVEIIIGRDGNGDTIMHVFAGKQLELAHYNTLLWHVVKALDAKKADELHEMLLGSKGVFSDGKGQQHV